MKILLDYVLHIGFDQRRAETLAVVFNRDIRIITRNKKKAIASGGSKAGMRLKTSPIWKTTERARRIPERI